MQARFAISPTDEARCKEGLLSPTHQLVCGYATGKDIRTLKDGTWLNDEVINEMTGLIYKSNPRYLRDYMVLNTFFLSNLLNGGIDRVKRWTHKKSKSINIFSKRIIFITMNHERQDERSTQAAVQVCYIAGFAPNLMLTMYVDSIFNTYAQF